MVSPEKPQIHIRTELIPDYVLHELLSAAYDAAAAYMEQPGVREKYERWLAEKEATTIGSSGQTTTE